MKLKKTIAIAALLTAGFAFAADARIDVASASPNRDTGKTVTPLSINICTPIGLPWGTNWDVCGFQVGVYNQVDDFTGWQIGVFNVTGYFCGWQVGAINVTDKMYGIQIGFINVIKDNDVPFLPIINCYF